MNKYVLKATALAIGALVGGSAVAAVTVGVNFDAATPTVSKYAKELAYNDTTPLASVNALNFSTKLGFGVSDTQTRYIRIDYTNATLDAAHGAVDGTDLEINNGAATDDAFAVVQGGQAGDSYVIYQVTAGADYSAATVVDFKVPDLRVISNNSAVSVTYSLHETAVSAVAGASGTAQLYSKTQAIATFATGLAFSLTPNTTTASVADSFTKFLTSGSTAGIDADTTDIGLITYSAAAGVNDRDGTAITLADLVAAGTKIVVTGDFSAAAGANDAAKKTNVFLDNNDNCGSSTVATNAFGASYASAEFVIDTNAATKNVCVNVSGTAEIKAGTYVAGVDVVAATGTATADIADATLGTINRDGTELYAPFATIYSGTGNRAVLTSQHSSDAAVVASAITEDGVTCNTGTTNFTLKAGKQLFINAADVCPTLSAGTRFALKLLIAAPNSKISGVYNSYTYDAATAKVTDLSSYPLQRPAN